jgi:hypothetical protein
MAAAAEMSLRPMSAVAGAGAGKAGTRTESDTMGKVEVANDVYWGAQTQRSLENFKIGGPQARMPIEIIRGAGGTGVLGSGSTGSPRRMCDVQGAKLGRKRFQFASPHSLSATLRSCDVEERYCVVMGADTTRVRSAHISLRFSAEPAANRPVQRSPSSRSALPP